MLFLLLDVDFCGGEPGLAERKRAIARLPLEFRKRRSFGLEPSGRTLLDLLDHVTQSDGASEAKQGR